LGKKDELSKVTEEEKQKEKVKEHILIKTIILTTIFSKFTVEPLIEKLNI